MSDIFSNFYYLCIALWLLDTGRTSTRGDRHTGRGPTLSPTSSDPDLRLLGKYSECPHFSLSTTPGLGSTSNPFPTTFENTST